MTRINIAVIILISALTIPVNGDNADFRAYEESAKMDIESAGTTYRSKKLDLSCLEKGEYVIYGDGTSIVIERDNEDTMEVQRAEITESSEILVPSGDIQIRVTDDVSLKSIYIEDGSLTIHSNKTITLSGETDSIYVNGNILIHGGTVYSSQAQSSGVFAEGNITVAGNGIIRAENSVHGVNSKTGNITVQTNNASILANNCSSHGVYAEKGNVEVSAGSISSSGNRDIGVSAGRDVLVSNAGTVIADNNGHRGINATGVIRVIDINTLVEAVGNTDEGIFAGYQMQVSGANITANENGSTGIMARSGVSMDSGANVYADNNGASYGIGSQEGDITVSGIETVIMASNNNSAGICANAGDINIAQGTMTATNNGDFDIKAKGQIIVDAGTLCGRGNRNGGIYAEKGSIVVENSGMIDGEGSVSGVWAEQGDITVCDTSIITGRAPYYAVRAGGEIEVVGQLIGIARYRGDDVKSTASIYTDEGMISAVNGGLIWEMYTDTPVDFNPLNPQNPYNNGSNIRNIANYDWEPKLELSGNGLLATADFDEVVITGIRQGSLDNEYIYLDGHTHKISFDGTVSVAGTDVIYMPNGAEGSYVEEKHYPGETIVIPKGDIFAAPEGYSFAHWNTMPNNDGQTYQIGEEMVVERDGLILYATWKENVQSTYNDEQEEPLSASPHVYTEELTKTQYVESVETSDITQCVVWFGIMIGAILLGSVTIWVLYIDYSSNKK